MLPLPLEPAGRSWDGIAGTFKTYALEQGYGPGIVPATGPIATMALAPPCDDTLESILDPGRSVDGTLLWKAEFVPGLPALPGLVGFEVMIRHDPAPPPSFEPPPSDGGPWVAPSWVRMYETLKIDGRLTIEGPAPRLVTAGEAIDVVLTDDGFASWLAEMPPETWSNANLYLQSGGGGIVPDQPAWSIELFREMGVPRNWAITYVDALTGELLGTHYCDIPCDR